MCKPIVSRLATGLLIGVAIFYSVVYGGEGYPDTPLIDAVFWGDLGRVRKLLDEGANVNSKTERGETALMMALSPDRIKLAMLLLDRGIEVNATTTWGATALIMAAARGHMEQVTLLLDKGADIRAKTTEGSTALKIADQNGHKEIVELLKAHGAKE
jgi:uncharacterized protein